MSIKQKIINLAPDPIVKIFAAPYVSGDTEQSAVTTAQRFWSEKHVHSTIDLLGEEVTSQEEVDLTITSYKKLIDLLGSQEYASISLKPTQLGSHLSPQVCQNNIEQLIIHAQKFQIPVTIDMEDHTYTDLTLDIYRNLLPKYPTLGTVLQTRLFRTADDIKSLKNVKARVRLCIGIYLEPASIALQHKSEMKERLFQLGEEMLDAGHYVEFGTHDEALINRLLQMTTRRGFPKNQFEIQMLMGVPRNEIQTQLISDGYTVRLYVPYALLWKFATAYCKRRLAANPQMGIYVTKNMIRSLFKRSK